jgi:threonine/homoserine/homoserine lactone efflux protein
MLEILVFAFGVMYTPGPVNGLALMTGMTERLRSALLFCVGVGAAMALLFLVVGALGGQVIHPWMQQGIGLVGGVYIAYLAFGLFKASGETKAAKVQLGFKTGFIMQITNPKSMIAVLPIVGVLFPKVGLAGWQVVAPSLILGVMAFGAPLVYLMAGWWMGKRIRPSVLVWINRLMAVLLGYLAAQFIVSSLMSF